MMCEIQTRPRTTKRVYFFKSGDQTFPGVRLPVNMRKYKHLDAVLDELTQRIPGLNRGVRTVSTPNGKHIVTQLDQLEHMGSYVCSDRERVRNIPGINLTKIRGLRDPEIIHAARNTFYTFTNDNAPKRVRKRKKGKKKIRRAGAQSDVGETSSTISQLAQQGSLFALTHGTGLLNTVDNGQSEEGEQGQEEEDGQWRQFRNNSEQEEEQGNTEEKWDSGRGSDEQEERRNTGDTVNIDNNNNGHDLPPLDGNRLKHVQRRRLATNQVDPDKYITPDSPQRDGGDGRGTTEDSRMGHGEPNGDVASLKFEELLSLDEQPVKPEERTPTAETQTRSSAYASNQLADVQGRQETDVAG